MNKLIFGILISFMLLSLVSAYKQDEIVDYQFKCLDISSNYCTASTILLISIDYPNGTNAYDNISMTYNPTYFNVTLPTSALGNDYNVLIISPNGNATSEWQYDVTATGLAQSTSQGIGSAVYMFIIFGLTVLFGFVGFKLSESQYLWILGIFCMFLAVLFVIYDVWLGYEYHRALSGFSSSAMPETIFYIFIVLLVLGILVSLALLFLKWKDLAKYYKNEARKKEEADIDLDFDE